MTNRNFATNERERIDLTGNGKPQIRAVVFAETLHRVPGDLLVDPVLFGRERGASVTDFYNRQSNRALVIQSGKNYHADELATGFGQMQIITEVSGKEVFQARDFLRIKGLLQVYKRQPTRNNFRSLAFGLSVKVQGVCHIN